MVSSIWVANMIGSILLLACYVIGLVLIILRSSGTARILGIVGILIMVLASGAGLVRGYLTPMLMDRFDLGVAVTGVGSIAIAVLSTVGVVLLGVAIVTGRRASEPEGVH